MNPERSTSGTTSPLFGLCVSIGPGAVAADYPVRPVRYIVPSAPGGSPDITARMLAAEPGRQMGQSFVVDNCVGASGIIGTDLIAKAAPDGYAIGQGLTPALPVKSVRELID
jgi:tripartite-type tricarboxylate transporter receptor subunit TctC